MLETHAIFGRVTPQQKRAMVEALQSRGHVVAMTGDGVNDVLALKDADIGVAMGSGSSATRAVAQLVLLDSTFDAMPSVVGEGRRVLGNIERTSNLYVTKTVYAMLIALGVGVVGLEFPFLPRQLTLIGALTIGIPSFFLALAPNDERARPGFLARVLRFTIPAGSLAAIATFLGYVLAKQEPGISLAEARTAATMVLLYIGFLVLTIIAAPLTTWRLALVWSMPALFGLVMVFPATREFFALYPPPLIVWLASFGIAALVVVVRPVVPATRTAGGPGRAAGARLSARAVRLDPADVRRRPDQHERLADHLVERDEAQPVPAVRRVAAVVAHHEERVVGDGVQRVVAGRVLRRLGQVRLVQRFPVDVDDVVADLDRLPGERDHALDEVLVLGLREPDALAEPVQDAADPAAVGELGRVRVLEHDHVPARDVPAVEHELADEDAVADLERRDHRLGGDVEGLDHEGLDQDRDRERDEDQERCRADEPAPDRAAVLVVRLLWRLLLRRSPSRSSRSALGSGSVSPVACSGGAGSEVRSATPSGSPRAASCAGSISAMGGQGYVFGPG